MNDKPLNACFVDLYWLPVAAGTGSRLRMWSLAAWEAFEALRARRPRARLCHSALKVRTANGEMHTVELTPVFRGEMPPLSMTGPVGFRGANRFRLLRYQVRCVRAARLPDEEWTLGSAVRLSGDCATASDVLALAAAIPKHIWGLRARGTSEMWTSDSAIAWMLERAGIDTAAIPFPSASRAPGWIAGVEVARWNAYERDVCAGAVAEPPERARGARL